MLPLNRIVQIYPWDLHLQSRTVRPCPCMHLWQWSFHRTSWRADDRSLVGISQSWHHRGMRRVIYDYRCHFVRPNSLETSIQDGFRRHNWRPSKTFQVGSGASKMVRQCLLHSSGNWSQARVRQAGVETRPSRDREDSGLDSEEKCFCCNCCLRSFGNPLETPQSSGACHRG